MGPSQFFSMALVGAGYETPFVVKVSMSLRLMTMTV